MQLPAKAALNVTLLAGEASGDLLGAALMAALRARHSDIAFTGIGGERMQQEGLISRTPMHRLSVMGLFEPLKRLPELLRIRRNITDFCLQTRPDVFIGIDSPDFNLPIERKLRAAGIKTVHYVSPSVWAWRQKRVIKIKQSVDLMLALFPFEAQFYAEHAVPVRFIGHPLADAIPLQPQAADYRQQLGLDQQARWLAVLPGSRMGETRYLAPAFLQTIAWCAQRLDDLKFVIPAANDRLYEHLQKELQQCAACQPFMQRIHLQRGGAQEAMGAADAILLASGTSTLEAMLLKRPMVVAYRLSALTYAIVRRMIKLPYFSLPNLLADEALVPEFVQKQVCAEQLGPAVLAQLEDSERRAMLQQIFTDIHQQLRLGASEQAADAILEIIGHGEHTNTSGVRTAHPAN